LSCKKELFPQNHDKHIEKKSYHYLELINFELASVKTFDSKSRWNQKTFTSLVKIMHSFQVVCQRFDIEEEKEEAE
jgi:hypothetical protein